MAEIECRHFNGYKPCGKSSVCDRSRCPSFAASGARVLIVHLEALGAVLRSTSLIAAVRRSLPGCKITWVTKTPALLQNLGVERILSLATEDLLQLEVLRFDLALVIDKSLAAAGVLARTQATEVRGFRANDAGTIVPANREALRLWELGLDDHEKFFVNTKSEQQLVHEALALGPYAREEYQVVLSPQEKETALTRRRAWSANGRPVIGLNTGCAATLPAKKLSVEGHCQLIRKIRDERRLDGCSIVLLGGIEDRERNAIIARAFPGVIESPVDKGLRDGLASVSACDLVFSGDSLGMHMAIGLRRWVVAWFGPSCAQEIDLYGRGVKLRTAAPCSPCWKRSCQQPRMCYDQVDFNEAVKALVQGLEWLTSSSRPHFPETSFSASL